MGYRSDLMVLIYPSERDDAEALYGQLKVLMNTTYKHVMDEFGEYAQWVDGAMALKFDIQDVKWYESYTDVQAFEAMMRDFDTYADDSLDGYCTELVRIGEDDEDLVRRYTGDSNRYLLGVSRRIDCAV